MILSLKPCTHCIKLQLIPKTNQLPLSRDETRKQMQQATPISQGEDREDNPKQGAMDSLADADNHSTDAAVEAGSPCASRKP